MPLDGSLETILSDVLIDPDAWSQGLHEISGSVNAFGAIMLPVTGKVPGAPLTPSLAHLAHDYFHGGWAARDERQRLVPKLIATGIAADQDYFNPADMARNDFWTDFLEPRGLKWFAGVRVSAGSETWCLALQRTPSQGPFTQAELDRLLRLSSPLSRAATLISRLGDAHLDGISDALQFVGLPAFVLDRHGHVIRHNADAEELLPGTLTIHRGELKVTGSPALSASLQRHVETSVGNTPASAACAGGLAIPHGAGKRLFLQAHPLRRGLASLFKPGCGLLLVTDPDRNVGASRAALKALFELTDREVAVVRLLAAGRSLSGAANQIGIGYETARTHLKSVFVKTGARKQSDLMTLVARLERVDPR